MKNLITLHSINSCGKQPDYLKKLIQDIWPTRAQEIYNLFVSDPIDIDTSEDYPFVIQYQEKPIGLTGFYYYDSFSVGLCWHGIHPNFRGQGISLEVFKRICLLAQKKYPNAIHIIELIPSDKITKLVPYFSKLGFNDSQELAKFDYLPKNVKWHIYKALLKNEF
jgi:hypothetical protein